MIKEHFKMNFPKIYKNRDSTFWQSALDIYIVYQFKLDLNSYCMLYVLCCQLVIICCNLHSPSRFLVLQ